MTKICNRCGEIKPLERFRKYYKGQGHYSFCKDCERVESRRKYLVRKAQLTEDEQTELNKIGILYGYQKQIGLRQKKYSNRPTSSEIVDALIEKARI